VSAEHEGCCRECDVLAEENLLNPVEDLKCAGSAVLCSSQEVVKCFRVLSELGGSEPIEE
jgi:hypothetical protein